MPKQDVPDDADPLFREVMDSIRRGNNPDHKRLSKLDADKRKAADKALKAAQRKRKGSHRGGDDDVINTGMFD